MKRACLAVILLTIALAGCARDTTFTDAPLVAVAKLGNGIYRLEGADHMGELSWSPTETVLVGLTGRRPYPAGECILFIACQGSTLGDPDLYSEIFVIDIGNHVRQQVLRTGKDGRFIDKVFWLPDGQHIGYEVYEYGNAPDNVGTWSISVLGTDDHLLSHDFRDPLASPDGTTIALNDADGIYLKDVYTSVQRQVFQSEGSKDSLKDLSWSLDGNQLTFADEQLEADNWTTRPRVHILNIATTQDTIITGEPFDHYNHPRLAPGNKVVAFERDKPSFNWRRIILADVTGDCQVAPPFEGYWYFSWSPDGSMLLVETFNGNYIVKLSEFIGPRFATTGTVCP